MSTVLDNTGIVDQYIEYPVNKIGVLDLCELRSRIRALNPDILIYLMPDRSIYQLIRDWLFFKLCGIRNIIGLKFSRYYQTRQYIYSTKMWEHEAHRLTRLIEELGPVDLANHYLWDLTLTKQERHEAGHILSILQGKSFLALSVGTKVDAKDWGEERWLELTRHLGWLYPNLCLVLIGSHDEFARCELLRENWLGLSLNLAGKLTPRVSAAVIEKAILFIGHDSGPMHLAASVGTPVVAIFSARNKPGEWFPFGSQNRVLYNKTDCFGCRADVCINQRKRCILGISVDEVLVAVRSLLGER